MITVSAQRENRPDERRYYMNPKHAQYMLTVYQEGSITNAAKKLYVSQPSLSQMIKLVESN